MKLLIGEATVTPEPGQGDSPALTVFPSLCKGTVKEEKRVNSQQKGGGIGFRGAV